MKIGIIGAMEEEVTLLRDKIENRQTITIGGSEIYTGQLHGVDVALLKSGIGKVAAAMGATLLLERCQPDVIINTGSAGGLASTLKVGDIVVSDEARYHDADVTAFGIYLGLWYPDVPRWIWILSIIFFIGAMNLCNVRVFGEMEFWLSLVKVVAIIAMMLAGAGIIFFGFGHSFPATGLENLWSHGGFAPNGWQGVIASLGIVMFAFGGVEIIGVTAAEAKEPKKVIPQAINTIPLRIILFYVCTLAVLMAIFPWNSFGEQGSPFVLIFDGLGIPAAATILNIIVISASISAINSDIFGAGRMMYGMSKEGLAPKSFQRIASNGVPWMTVVVMGGALLAAVVLNYLIPEQVFVLIASLAAFATVWVWLMILLSHFAMRRGLSAEERSQIAFPIPFWPVAPLLTLLFMGLVIAVLGMFAETRMALIAGLVWLGLLTVVWYARVRKTALQVVTEQ